MRSRIALLYEAEERKGADGLVREAGRGNWLTCAKHKQA